MAKRNDSASAGDKAKVRVFFAEVEGNNDSVQEALRTMVSAMTRPVRIISDQKGNGAATKLIEQTQEEHSEDVSPDDVVDDLNEEAEQQIVRKTRGTGDKKDRNAGLELVPNLNFRPDSQLPLKDFSRSKDPKNDVEAVIVVLHYMQHAMRLEKIGPAHVLTAFKEIGRAIPGDLRQTIRNIKKTKMWLNFTDIEEVKTTTQGENFVEHEMGKSK